MSYLIRADELTVLLFDCGLGTGGAETVFDANAQALGVDLDDLDCLVVSHLHADHVGGAGALLRRTFSLGKGWALPASLPAFVPIEMDHPRADVCVVEQARVLGKGVAMLPPLPRMLFWLGRIAEQALVVNVRGRGLVLVTGCGHPQIERTLAEAEQVVDAPGACRGRWPASAGSPARYAADPSSRLGHPELAVATGQRGPARRGNALSLTERPLPHALGHEPARRHASGVSASAVAHRSADDHRLEHVEVERRRRRPVETGAQAV